MRLEHGFPDSHKKYSVPACSCNLSTGEAETGGTLGLAGKLVLPNQWRQLPWKVLSQKVKGKKKRGQWMKIQTLNPSLCMHAHAHKHVHTHTLHTGRNSHMICFPPPSLSLISMFLFPQISSRTSTLSLKGRVLHFPCTYPTCQNHYSCFFGTIIE